MITLFLNPQSHSETKIFPFPSSHEKENAGDEYIHLQEDIHSFQGILLGGGERFSKPYVVSELSIHFSHICSKNII